MIARTGAAVAALVLLTACGTSGGGSGSQFTPQPESSSASTSSAAPTVASTTAPKPKPVNPNIAVCSRAQDYLSGPLRNTFSHWDTTNNLYSQKVAEQLRTHATRIFGLQASARGAVAQALEREATALTKLSVSIESLTHDGFNAAAEGANVALAQVRGVCHF